MKIMSTNNRRQITQINVGGIRQNKVQTIATMIEAFTEYGKDVPAI